MAQQVPSTSPAILLRITDGSFHICRSFSDFNQAVRSAEAYAGAGLTVAMISATGQYLMSYDPRGHRIAL